MKKTKPVRGSCAKPDHIMISFYDDSRRSMAVTWRTSTDVADGYAEYRSDGGETMICEAESHIFESDIDISVIHTARLKNLTPGTKYYYTCGNKNNRSSEFSFETQAENVEKFTFLALADFQKGEPHDLPDYSNLGSFIKKILKEHPEIKFILSAGDSTDCGQHEQQWNGLFCGLEGIIESVPFMMALGNHDNRGFEDYEKGIGRYYAEPAEFFCSQFCKAYPDNGAENWKTENYSFDYGDAHFIIFSINGPEETDEWAKKDLQKGDLVFYKAKGSRGGASHVGLYIGGGQVIHESRPGIGVKISPVTMMQYVTARRVINSNAVKIAEQKKLEEEKKNEVVTDNTSNTTNNTNVEVTNNNDNNIKDNNVVSATPAPTTSPEVTPSVTPTPSPTATPNVVVTPTPTVEATIVTNEEESN